MGVARFYAVAVINDDRIAVADPGKGNTFDDACHNGSDCVSCYPVKVNSGVEEAISLSNFDSLDGILNAAFGNKWFPAGYVQVFFGNRRQGAIGSKKRSCNECESDISTKKFINFAVLKNVPEKPRDNVASMKSSKMLHFWN